MSLDNVTEVLNVSSTHTHNVHMCLTPLIILFVEIL